MPGISDRTLPAGFFALQAAGGPGCSLPARYRATGSILPAPPTVRRRLP